MCGELALEEGMDLCMGDKEMKSVRAHLLLYARGRAKQLLPCKTEILNGSSVP